MAAAWPQNYVVVPGEQFQDFESTTGFGSTRQSGGSGESYALDTTYVREGSSSMRFTTPPNGTYWGELTFPAYSEVVKNRQIGVWVYIPDHTQIDQITIYAAKESGYTNFITFPYKIMGTGGNANRFNGWHFVETNPGGWSAGLGTVAVGSDTWAAMKIRVQPQTGFSGVTVYFDDMWINRRSRAKVLITADDGYASWFSRGLPILDAVGFKSTISVIGSFIGLNATWATLADLRSASANGHALITHGEFNLTEMTEDAAVADIQMNQEYLRSVGLGDDVNHYVIPFGAINSTVTTALRRCGIVTARGVVKPTLVGLTGGLAERALYYNIAGGEQTDAPATLTGLINNAITYGQTCVLMFHNIVASGASAITEYNEADLQTIVTELHRLYRLGLVDVMTVPQWYSGLNQPTLVAA